MKINFELLRNDIKKFMILNGVKQNDFADGVKYNKGNFSLFIQGKRDVAPWRLSSFCIAIGKDAENYIMEE